MHTIVHTVVVTVFLFDGPTKIQFVANIDSVANIGIRCFFSFYANKFRKW